MNFKGCKYLDFNQEKYTCELVNISGHLGWERKTFDGDMQLCQMCKLRGRLNHPESCVGKGNAMCSDYDEIDFHIV